MKLNTTITATYLKYPGLSSRFLNIKIWNLIVGDRGWEEDDWLKSTSVIIVYLVVRWEYIFCPRARLACLFLKTVGAPGQDHVYVIPPGPMFSVACSPAVKAMVAGILESAQPDVQKRLHDGWGSVIEIWGQQCSWKYLISLRA